MRRQLPIATSLVTAVLAAGLTLAPAAPATAAAAPAQATVTLTSNKPMIVKGTKVWLSGKVRSKRTVKGLTLVVQQKRVGGTWKKVGTTTVRARGLFTWSEKPKTATKRSYRVLLARSARVKAARSAPVAVAVAEWKSLAKMSQPVNEYLYHSTSSFNGVNYPNSLETSYYAYGSDPWPTLAFSEVNLYRNCYRVTTALALSDDTRTGTSASGRVLVDGTERAAARTDQLGVRKPLSVNVEGIYRARFEMDLPGVAPRNGTVSTFLSPKFLCTSD